MTEAARALGLERSHLYKKCAQLGIDVQKLRRARLSKMPGVSETLDWASALVVLHAPRLTPEIVAETLGCVVKDEADLRKIRTEIDAGRLPVGAA